MRSLEQWTGCEVKRRSDENIPLPAPPLSSHCMLLGERNLSRWKKKKKRGGRKVKLGKVGDLYSSNICIKCYSHDDNLKEHSLWFWLRVYVWRPFSRKCATGYQGCTCPIKETICITAAAVNKRTGVLVISETDVFHRGQTWAAGWSEQGVGWKSMFE